MDLAGAEHGLLLSEVHPTSTNRSRQVAALGKIDGVVFSVYCSECSLVILDNDFHIVQKIEEQGGADCHFLAVDTCLADGKIASIAKGSTHIYRPRKKPTGNAVSKVAEYEWQKIASLPSQGALPRCLSWNPLGDRLVVGGEYFTIWGHKAVVVTAADPSRFVELMQTGEESNPDYVPQSSRKLPGEAKQVSYSPDGRLIGSVAENDRLLKVWYSLPIEISRYQLDESPDFVYLEHPESVGDFSWRTWPDFTIHSTFVVNVMVTSCRDNLCRVWSESAAEEPFGMFLTAIIDPETFPGFEPVTSGFRLHWLDCRSLLGELETQVDGLRSDISGNAGNFTLFEQNSKSDDTASTDAPASEQSGATLGVDLKDGGGGDDSDFVVITGDGGFRSAVMTPSQFSMAENSLVSPHVPSKVTRGCLTMVRPPEGRSAISDILYFVHPNGSLVFWSISYLDAVPRRSPFIKLISGTDVNVISVRDGASVIGRVEACLDRGLCLWRRRVHNLAKEGHGDFEYSVPRSTSLALIMHHVTGDVTKWNASFADRGSFGEVLEVHETARVTGSRSVVLAMESHSTRPEVISASPAGSDLELIVWCVQSAQGAEVQHSGGLRRVACTLLPNRSSPAVFAWVPVAAHSIFVVASQFGLSVHCTDVEHAEIRQLCQDSTCSLHAISCLVHSGLASACCDDAEVFYVTVLQVGGTLLLWRLIVATNGSTDVVAVPLTMPDPRSFVNSFDIPGDHLSSLGLFDAENTDDGVYVGVVNTNGSVAVLKCPIVCDNGSITCAPTVLLEGSPATIPEGEIRVIACSSSGHWALAMEVKSATGGTSRFDVSVWRWRLTGNGPALESVIFSGSSDSCDLVWGSSQNQKETLYVLTDDEILVYSSRTVAGFSDKNGFAMISRTPRASQNARTCAASTPRPILRSTVCGVLLVTGYNEIHCYSNCARYFGRDDESPTTLEQAVSRSDRVLPQFHDVLLADLLFAGRGDRITAILHHVADSLRKTATTQPLLNTGGSMQQVSPLLLSELYSEVVDGQDQTETPSTKKYEDLFDARSGQGQSESVEDARVVRDALTKVGFDGLSRREQVAALSFIEAYAVLDENRGSLDDCGVRFFVPALHLSFLNKQRGAEAGKIPLEPSHYAWALHSEAQEFILEKCPGLGVKGSDLTWNDLQTHGAGYWIRSLETLKRYIEIIARNQFNKTKQPLDCAIWYTALRKKKTLWGLFKSVQDSRMSNFFGFDFTQEENKVKALKNAYALLSKRRHSEAVAFFLLGDAIDEAVSTCIRNLHDVQLAIVICRLYEEDHSGESPTLTKLLEDQHESATNPFSKTIFAWLLKKSEAAVQAVLIEQVPGGQSDEEVDAPAALNLCRFLQNHPHVKKLKDSVIIQRIPSGLYYQAYASYMRRGLPLLALDTLVEFEVVFRASLSEANQGGATSGTTGPAPAATTAVYSSAVETGNVDFFGGFGGFDDEFAIFDAAPPEDTPQETVEVQNGNGKDSGNESVVSEIILRLVSVWQVETCLKLVANNFLAAPPETCWKHFSDVVDKQAITTARLCGSESIPQFREQILQRCNEVSIALGKKWLQCMIAACHGAEAVSNLIRDICDTLIQRVQQLIQLTHAVPSAKALNRTELTAQIEEGVNDLAVCLQQVFANEEQTPILDGARKAECIVILYSSLWISCWSERKIASLHALLVNRPDVDQFKRSAGGGAPQLLELFLKDVSIEQYEELDMLADQDEDGNAVITTHPPNSAEGHEERYRWALLDVAAMQKFLLTVRELVQLSGIADVHSRQIDAMFEILEELTAAMECTLATMPPPLVLLNHAAAEHSVHGLFKMRTLQEAKENRFQSFESRRLWAYLVSQDDLHRLIEHHIFNRSQRAGESAANIAESAIAYSSGKTESEIYSICVNPNRPTQLVLGTSKGLVELSCDDVAVNTGTSFAQVYSGNSTPPLFSPLSRSRPRTPDGDSGQLSSPDGTGTVSPISLNGQGVLSGSKFAATLHRPTNGSVRAIAQHPVMPCYVSGTSHGDIDLWHYDQQHFLSRFETYSQTRTTITSLHFSDLGNKFGATMASGDLALWRFLTQDESDEPYLAFRAHSRRSNDFAFAGASSLVVTGGVGSGSDGGNVALWDTLLMSTDRSCQAYPVRVFNVNESGTLSIAYSKANQRIFCGGSKGEITVIDFRQQKVVKSWVGHEGAVNKLLVDETHGTLVTASASGAAKLWALNNLRQIANFEGLHARSSFSLSGVVGMDLHDDSLYTCGLDGCVKVTFPWLVFGGK